MFFSKTKVFPYIFFFATLVSCGVFSPEFKDFEDDDATAGKTGSGPADAKTECGAAALKLFTDNIQPVVATNCAISGCHASGGGAAKLPLSASVVESNRTQFFNYSSDSTTKLTSYINSAAHPGKSVAGNLNADSVAEWVTKENECAQGK